jgi:VanZ family protein
VTETRLSTRARVVILLGFAVAILLYGSFYPWKPIHPRPGAWRLFWDPRQLRHELILNIVLYVPAGFLLYGATRSAAISIAGGFLLSGLIEGTQPFFARDARALDLAANTAGAVAGTLSAVLIQWGRRELWLPSQPLTVLSIWGFHELYPFVRDAAYGFYNASSFARASPTQFAEALVDWLAAFTLAAVSFPRRARLAVGCAAFILPLRPFLTGMQTSRMEWLAWALAAAASLVAGRRLIGARRCAGVALAVTLLIRELAPYHLASVAAPFHYKPFEALLSADWFFAVVIVTHKAFVYAAIIYLLGAPRFLVPVAIAVSSGLAVLEWVQRYLPGRTAEITDPLIAMLLAAALILLPPAKMDAADRLET